MHFGASMDAALKRWAFTKAKNKIFNPKLSLGEFREEWRSKDKVPNILIMNSSKRFHTD